MILFLSALVGEMQGKHANLSAQDLIELVVQWENQCDHKTYTEPINWGEIIWLTKEFS